MRPLLILLFTIFATITFLTNCGTSQQVTVHDDHSALVSVSEDSASYFKSVLIKDYTSTPASVLFTISEVDSVGNYLSPVFNKNYFKVNYYGDSLEFSDGYGEPFVNPDFKSCCGHQLVLTFDKQVTGIKTKNKFVTLKKNKVYIVKSRNDFYTEKTYVTIYLKD